MSYDFVGTGWAFPLEVDAPGGIALARATQELEQAMRLILPRTRASGPCAPSSARRLRDFVFRSATIDTAADWPRGARTRCCGGSRGST